LSTIYKRGSTWWYRKGGAGRPDAVRKSLRTTSKTIAQQLKKELDLQYAKIALGLKPEVMVVLLSDAIEEWIRHIEYKKKDTSSTIKSRPNSHYKKQILHVNAFKDFCIPSITVNKITTSAIIDWKSRLLVDYTNKTARHYLMTLREFFKFCYNKAYLGIPIFDNLGNGFLPSSKPTTKRRPIKVDLIKDAIENAPNLKDKIYWSIMLYSLLRRQDAGSLSMSDIVQGKFESKTGEPKPLGLPKWIKDNPKIAVNVYPSEWGQKQSLKRYQTLMKERHQIEYTDFHSIRHSVATHLSKKGYKEADIKRITGHHSTAVDNYIHAGNKELERLIDNL
jgi:integrase